MKLKLNFKTMVSIGALAVAFLFISSMLVIFTYGGERGKGFVYVTVDMGSPGEVYRSKIPFGEESNALSVISSYAGKIVLSEGKLQCIHNYCNNEYNVWKFYTLEESAVGFQEIEINETLENYIVTSEESLIFRYAPVSG